MKTLCVKCGHSLLAVVPSAENGYKEWTHQSNKWDEGHDAEPVPPEYCKVFHKWLILQAYRDSSVKVAQTKAYDLAQRLYNECGLDSKA